MRVHLALVSLLCGCAVQAPYAPVNTELGEDPVLLPTTLWDGYFLVEAELDGSGPYTFMLDTGSDCMLVSPAIADRLWEQVQSVQNTVRGANGDAIVVDRILSIGALKLGSARLQGFHALVMDVEPLSEALGAHIDGVLGLPLFSDCLLTLDYPSREVRLSRGALSPVDQREVLALNPGETGEITATLGEHPISFKIDSGFSREIGLPTAGNLDFVYGPRPGSEIVTITGTHRQQEGRLAGELRLGHHVFPRPRAAINGGDPKLGSRLLRHFTITFDQQNHRVRFAR
jgi:hypothetical protein